MNEDSFKLTVGSPIYLLRSVEPCWKCRRPQPVIALATRRLKDTHIDQLDVGDSAEPYLLSNIDQMPAEIFDCLAKLHPQYRIWRSHTAGAAYYANLCGECGANFGDFYLFNEPEHAFFPQTEEQAEFIRISKLPFEGEFEFHATYGVGIGGFIFEHAQQDPPA